MSGYWERVIARYTEGKHTFGLFQRYVNANSGRLYDSGNLVTGDALAGSLAAGARNVYLVPFINPINALFTRAAVNVEAINNQPFYIAIYRDTFRSSGPLEQFSLVRNLGTGNANNIGLCYTPTNTFQLDQGFYWLALAMDDDLTITCWKTNSASHSFLGYDPHNFDPAIFFNVATLHANNNVALPNWNSLLFVSVQGDDVTVPRIFLEFRTIASGMP